MKMPIPRLYLGTMTFGWSQASSKVEEIVAMDMVKRFIRHNEESSSDVDEQVVYRIDTARIYAGGKTETIVGAVLSKLSSESDDVVVKGKILVGTKAHPTQTGGLSKAGIENQWQESTEALKRMPSSSLPMIDEYYLHQPDTLHSLHESLEYAHELVLQKKASKIGMSNYHASEVKRAFELCKEMNLTPPTVYQGL
jgi:aflatoxin B1 aldehyde reductase